MRSGLGMALRWGWRRLSADSLRQRNYVWWFSSRCLRRHRAKGHAEDGRATLPTHLTLTSVYRHRPYTHKTHEYTLVWKKNRGYSHIHINASDPYLSVKRIHLSRWRGRCDTYPDALAMIQYIKDAYEVTTIHATKHFKLWCSALQHDLVQNNAI